jgi:hypothetical protein
LVGAGEIESIDNIALIFHWSLVYGFTDIHGKDMGGSRK